MIRLTSILLLVCSILLSCNNSDNSVQQAKPVVIKEDCGFTDNFSDSSFLIDSIPVTVSYRIFCSGDFVVFDTLSDGTINSYRNQLVEVKIATETSSKSVTISKNDFKNYFDNSQLNTALLGSTEIEEIDSRNKTIIMSTFIGHPRSDNGVMLKYSLTIDGQFKYIETFENEME